MLNKKRNKKKGFTLIELVIVLAVLAIIALIAIPNFNKVREDSQKKADDRSLEAIEKVIDMAIIDKLIADDVSTGEVITITKSAAGANAGKFVVDAGGALAISAANQAKINVGLEKVGEPQTKNKTEYLITVTNGEVTSKATN